MPGAVQHVTRPTVPSHELISVSIGTCGSTSNDGRDTVLRSGVQRSISWNRRTRRHATRQIYILPPSLWPATTYRLEARDRDLRPHALEILRREHARADRQGIRRPRSDSVPERFLQRPAAHHAIRDSGERAIA